MVTEPELAVSTSLISLTAVEGLLPQSIIIKSTMVYTMADMSIAQLAQFITARYMGIMVIMLDQAVTMEKKEVLPTAMLSVEGAVVVVEDIEVIEIMVDTLDKSKNFTLEEAVCSVTTVWMLVLDI